MAPFTRRPHALTRPDENPRNENGPGLRRGPPPAMDSAGKQASIANEVNMTAFARITKPLFRLTRRKHAPVRTHGQIGGAQ